MKYEERLNAIDYLLLLMIVVAFAAVSWIYQINQHFSYDQWQMLLKGYYAAFTGTYLPFGNEASTMGNVPGMLSSWLIGFPLQVYMHPYAPAVFQTLIRAAGILIFANALTLLFTRRIVLLGTFLFALSPWTLYQSMLYNPAYLTFCAPLVLNAILRLRYDYHDHYHDKNSRHRIFPSFLLVIAIGMVVQLHFSWPVLVVGALILWLRRDIKVSYIGIGLGVLVLALSLWPYIQESLRNPNLFNNPEAQAQDRYIGYGLLHVYPIFKGLLYWLRFASFSVTEKAIVPEIEDEYSLLVVILCWVWIILSQAFGVISVIIAAYGNLFALSGAKAGTDVAKSHFIRGLTISFILAMIIASAASPVVLNFWQIAVVIPFALLPLLAWLSANHKYIKIYFIAALVFFICANAMGALKSEKFDYANSFDEGLYSTCLMTFAPEKCAALSAPLSEAKKLELQAIFKFNQQTYDRVIMGLVPLADGSLKPVQSVTIPFLSDSESSADNALVSDAAIKSADASSRASADNKDANSTKEQADKGSSVAHQSDTTASASSDGAEVANKTIASSNQTNDAAAKAKETDAKAAEDAKSTAAEDAKSKTPAAAKAATDGNSAENSKANAPADSKANAAADSKEVVDGKVASEAEVATKSDLAKADSAEPVVKKLKLNDSALFKALPTLADEIQNKTYVQQSVEVTKIKTAAATKDQDSSNLNGKVSASHEQIVTATYNNVGKNSKQGNDSSITNVSVVKADTPLVNSGVIVPVSSQGKAAETGVIIDAGSGDKGELIIN